MNKIIPLIFVISFIFSGTLYIGVDNSTDLKQSQYGFSYETQDVFSGGFSIGYNHPFIQKKKVSISWGLSYNIIPNKSDADDEFGFFNVYLMPAYHLTDKAALWLAYGVSDPTHDIDHLDNGNVIGAGLNFKLTDSFSLGAGLVENIFEIDNIDYEYSGVKVFLGFAM